MRLGGRPWQAWLAAALLVILSVADILTTNRILARGGHEANPFMAWLMAILGPQWMVAKVLATAVIAFWLVADWEHRLAKVAMAAAIGLSMLFVGWNLVMILWSSA